MILHAAAWEATAGKFGWMIMTQTGARAVGTGPYGFFGGLLACGWVHGLVGAALVALATWHGVSSTPSALMQQSRLEMGPIESWWRVRLPLASAMVDRVAIGDRRAGRHRNDGRRFVRLSNSGRRVLSVLRRRSVDPIGLDDLLSAAGDRRRRIDLAVCDASQAGDDSARSASRTIRCRPTVPKMGIAADGRRDHCRCGDRGGSGVGTDRQTWARSDGRE